MKNIRFFLSELFPFLFVKCSMYLDRRVFAMKGAFFFTSWLKYCFRDGIKGYGYKFKGSNFVKLS